MHAKVLPPAESLGTMRSRRHWATKRSPRAGSPLRGAEARTRQHFAKRIACARTWRAVHDHRTAMHRSILRTDQLREERLRAAAKDADQRSPKIPLRHHLKVHLFRALTVVLAWFLIVAAFYERPEALTATQRLIQHGIESLGDAIPSPWGPRIEFVFREIGGFIWLQITLFVVMLRIVLSTLAAMWRLIIRRDRAV
jgi:hypothetical protein